MDDASRRSDEAEALASMFGDDSFFQISPYEWVLRCSLSDGASLAELTIRLPERYPSCSPPELILDAPWHCDLRQTCGDLLLGFEPGEEFVITLAQRFFEWCDRLDCNGSKSISKVPANSDGDLITETSSLAVVITIRPEIANEIGSSLVAAGFQECGARVFVQGELGVAVEMGCQEVHVSIDGLDAKDEIVGWVTKRLDDELHGFGKDLLEWVDSQRASGETEYGSADGINEATVDGKAGKIILTGNAAWKARLQAGEIVEFRGGGNSLHPRIKSGECCRYAPVFKHEDIKEKDIVFCQIKGRFWGHMVKKKTFVGGSDEYEYTISNIHGWENGTCTLEHVYGKVIDHWK